MGVGERWTVQEYHQSKCCGLGVPLQVKQGWTSLIWAPKEFLPPFVMVCLGSVGEGVQAPVTGVAKHGPSFNLAAISGPSHDNQCLFE